jgi:hypothetical protein
MTTDARHVARPDRPGNGRRLALRVAKLSLLAAVLIFVIVAIRRDINRIEDWSVFQPDPVWILLSILAALGVASVQIMSYRHLLRCYGQTPTWNQMMAIAWVPPLGKYVPGKVAAIAGATYMLKRYGVNVTIALSVVLLMDAFPVLLGLVIGSPVLTSAPVSSLVPGGAWIAAAVVICGVVLLHPRIFGWVVNRGLKWMGRAPLERMPSLAEYFVPLMCAIAQWVFAGLSLWCMTRSLVDIELTTAWRFIVIQAAAGSVGYLALFAPGGLGVTEGVRMLTLPSLLGHAPAGTVALIVVAMRLMQVAIELSLAAVGGLLHRREAARVGDDR